jgi:8-oxo-dGTP pyrophosphatase MutT (NUDIX family)
VPEHVPDPVGSRGNPVPRQGGRVLLIDNAGRLLLVRGSDPGRPGSRYWFTVGGGLEQGETVAQGAARELHEETGLRTTAAELGEPLFSDVTEFPYEGTWYRQEQSFFILRVASWDVPVEQLNPAEADFIHEHRWWSVADLESTGEKVYPVDLADTLRRILGGAEVV